MIVKKLSIVIPVFNERKTLREIINKVEKADIGEVKKEIIIVDDGSTDGTKEILKKLCSKYKIIFHKKNQGKGTALRTGFKHCTGEAVVIQDADLEYEPDDFKKMLEKMNINNNKVVYGSRRLSNKKIEHGGWMYFWGGSFLNLLTNLLYGLKISDEATCYKMVDRKLLNSLKLKCKKFEFCPEVTAKIAKRGYTINEVPISYQGRKKAEGKKIKLSDGLEAIWTLIKYRLIK
jgi:glycosyltransferase involved in cell wall biosynthesis